MLVFYRSTLKNYDNNWKNKLSPRRHKLQLDSSEYRVEYNLFMDLQCILISPKAH